MGDKKNTAIVLKVKDRFFSGYKNKRIQTAWSLAGANLFGCWQEDELKRIESILIRKKHKPERVKVFLGLKLDNTTPLGQLITNKFGEKGTLKRDDFEKQHDDFNLKENAKED